MEGLGLVILVAIGVVGFFVIGMSLTLMIKGHHIKSEISDNEHLRAKGIKCAAQMMFDEERVLRGETACDSPFASCSPAGCSSCGNNNTPHH